ncbi:MAG: hypothetical protein K6G15_04265 [Desulfovibrio sp.]|nr:hypothetical protein [Desulfovibrio sp.]
MKKRLMFYGDSNVWGYIPFGGRIASHDRFPQQAGQFLENSEIVECGLNGRCSAYSHELFPQELLGGASFTAEFLQSLPLDALILMLGTNDVMDPLNLSARSIAENLRRMIREAHAISSTIPVLVISPPAIAQRSLWELVGLYHCEKDILEQKLAPVLAKMACEENVHFLDARDAVPEFDAEDGMHLSIDGHHALGKACGKALRNILDSSNEERCSGTVY